MREHPILGDLARAIREGRAASLVTVLSAAPGSAVRPGAKLLVSENADSPAKGETGDPALDREVVAQARDLLRTGATERRTIGGAEVFIQSFAPPPVLYVIGAVYPAAALAEMGRFLGFRVIVCDPRSPFATPERLPSAHEIVRKWPHDYLASVTLTSRDAVCILTHDIKFDVPALEAALRSGAGYIGAMGSRKTHERRVARLREDGVSEADLARISAPIGLDIGAATPEEVAVSIAAELVARRKRKPARSPAHPEHSSL